MLPARTLFVTIFTLTKDWGTQGLTSMLEAHALHMYPCGLLGADAGVFHHTDEDLRGTYSLAQASPEIAGPSMQRAVLRKAAFS